MSWRAAKFEYFLTTAVEKVDVRFPTLVCISDGVSRLVSRLIFASLAFEGFWSSLDLEVYRSRDFEYCKEMVW